MQAITGNPRGALTDQEVIQVLQNCSAMVVSAGAELLNQSLAVVEDISDDMEQSGTVKRNNFATLHGSCSLKFRRVLDWGSAIVRPYINLSDGVTTTRFNLGAYYTNVPRVRHSDSLPLYEVEGFDILHRLNDPLNEVYAVTQSSNVLATVEAILVAQGYIRYTINNYRADASFSTNQFWTFTDTPSPRWLTVVNDMLASIGYQGIWSDWEGTLQCQPYTRPTERPSEWVYDQTDPNFSMVYPERVVEHDFFDAPNRWTFYQNNMPETTPVLGNGVYTYTNWNVGDTSVNARGGRIISRVEGVEATDQVSLINRTFIAIDADMRQKFSIYAATSPNPLHWHGDRMYVRDPKVGMFDVIGANWSLPLDGGAMTHEWTVLEL